MNKHDVSVAKSVAFFVLVLVLGAVITIYTQTRTAPPAKAVNTTLTDPSVVTSAPSTSKTQSSEVHSSNADKKLVLRATRSSDGTTYAFSVADISGENERLIFSKTLPAGASMTLPINAWDPTDTYVFVEETIGNTLTYYVLRANGEPFANGETFIDVGAIWQKKEIGYHIRTATGWASGTLLIIYTSKDDGSKGPAFWFEIPSTAIIQLAG